MRYLEKTLRRIYDQMEHRFISLTQDQADYMFLLIKNNAPEYPFGFTFDVYEDKEIIVSFDYIDVDDKELGYLLYASFDNHHWKPVDVLSLEVLNKQKEK